MVRGAGSKIAVHQLIGRTWRGARREELLKNLQEEREFVTVEHWNQQLLDNRAANLVWVTKPLHKREGEPADPHDPRRSVFERQ